MQNGCSLALWGFILCRLAIYMNLFSVSLLLLARLLQLCIARLPSVPPQEGVSKREGCCGVSATFLSSDTSGKGVTDDRPACRNCCLKAPGIQTSFAVSCRLRRVCALLWYVMLSWSALGHFDIPPPCDLLGLLSQERFVL